MEAIKTKSPQYEKDGNIIFLENKTTETTVSQIKATFQIKNKNRESYFLRSSHHLAQVTHWCDNCCSYINPGETYEKAIRKMGKRIVEFKLHIQPSCDFPKPPDDYDPYHEEISNAA